MNTGLRDRQTKKKTDGQRNKIVNMDGDED